MPVETVDAGDVASFTFTEGDVQVTRTGKVATVHYQGNVRVFESEEGRQLVSYNIHQPRAIHCEMIARYEPLQPTLFEA